MYIMKIYLPGFYYILIICILYPSKLKSDSLIPYEKGGHHDTKRNHRYVRECQKVEHGNRTHEYIAPKDVSLDYETMYFKHHTHYGHRTIIKHPFQMISVAEPDEPGSCRKHEVSTVTNTAKKQKCVVAINAGFFNPDKNDKSNYGMCYGNIISDGRMVQDSKGVQNACFGIRRDGTVVIGYLSEDEVIDKVNPFVQLICGVGWVLREGKVYLNESIKAECRDTETTGTLEKFFNVKAGRSLIGYDKNGYVHLMQFDGKTGESGIDLWSAAEYMKSLGIINAINFDGGGSSTFVLNGNLINYPSNECNGKGDELCERDVSTIICVHDVRGKSDSVDSLWLCCNRNYLIIIGMTVVIGFTLLLNVYICGYFMSYRSRFLVLSGATQKGEALKSLLDQNGHYSTGDDDSDDDEI